MNKSYFVDTCAYLAFGRNEFWTLDLEKTDNIFTSESIYNELSSILRHNENGDAKVKVTLKQADIINSLIKKTNILSDSEISFEVNEAHSRCLQERYIKNPDTALSYEDLQIVECAKSYAQKNSNLETLIVSCDRTMCEVSKSIIGTDLSVIDPFSKSLFDLNIIGVKPHFVLESALDEFEDLINSGFDFNEMDLWGNVWMRDRVAYVYSFTNEPVKKSNICKNDRSFLVTSDKNLSPYDVERGVKVYGGGGRFLYSDESCEFKLNVVKKPSFMDVLLFRKMMSDDNNLNGAVDKFNNIFDRGDKSIIYTVTNSQLKGVCDTLLVEGLNLRRKNSLI